MWHEVVGTIATVIAVFGVVLNNRRMRVCFLVWLVSNALSCAIHVSAALWALAIRDAIFLVLAVEGWLLWKDPANPPAMRRRP